MLVKGGPGDKKEATENDCPSSRVAVMAEYEALWLIPTRVSELTI